MNDVEKTLEALRKRLLPAAKASELDVLLEFERLYTEEARTPHSVSACERFYSAYLAPLAVVQQRHCAGTSLVPSSLDSKAEAHIRLLSMALRHAPQSAPVPAAASALAARLLHAPSDRPMPPTSIQLTLLLLYRQRPALRPSDARFRAELLLYWLGALSRVRQSPPQRVLADLLMACVNPATMQADTAALALETVFVLLAGAPIDAARPELLPSDQLQKVIEALPISVSSSVPSYICNAAQILDEHRLLMVGQRLIAWRQTKTTSVFVLRFLEGLSKAGKRQILCLMAYQLCPTLLERFVLDEPSAWCIARYFLLGYQHSSDLVLHSSAQLEKALRNNPDQVADTVHCLIMHFALEQQHPFVALAQLPQMHSSAPSREHMRAVITHSSWALPHRLASQKASSQLPPPLGFSGLRNLGNTCYMNSQLQVLFLSEDFRRFILMHVALPGAAVLSAVQKVLCALQLASHSEIIPKGMLEAIDDDERFSRQRQADASEFVSCVLDRLEVEMGLDQAASQVWFGGELESVVTCQECRGDSARQEVFTELSLSIPDVELSNEQPLQLVDLVEKALADVKLEGENAYRCSRCGRKTVARTRSRLTRLARHVPICFKRFRFDLATNCRRKILKAVQFRCLLKLRVQSRSCWLVLYACVVHSGSSADHGHYYTIGRPSAAAVSLAARSISNASIACDEVLLEKECSAGDWLMFSDSSVTRSSFAVLRDLSRTWPCDTTYLCFYARVNEDVSNPVAETQ